MRKSKKNPYSFFSFEAKSDSSKKPSLFDDYDEDEDSSNNSSSNSPDVNGPPLFNTSQKAPRSSTNKASTRQQRSKKPKKPQLFDSDDEDDSDNGSNSSSRGNDNGAVKPPILPAVPAKLPPAPMQSLPPPPSAANPGLPPPNTATVARNTNASSVSHRRAHDDFDDDSDDDDDDDDIESDEDDDFDDPKATKAALKKALEENELLKKQLAQKTQLLVKKEAELKDAVAKLEQSQSKAQAFEERLRRYTEKEAAQNKTFDQLLARVEANLSAANARAAQAEQRAAGLEAALDMERSKVAQLEMIEVAPGEFPNWQEARKCIMTQRLQLAQARQRTKEVKEVFKTITEGSAKNLIALAKYVKDFNQLSLMLSSYDKILEEDDGSSALLD